jgi:hypothetical protein
VNERGPQLGKAEVDRLEKAVQKSLDGASWLMLCGSLPPGVPSDFYARLIGMARRKKVKTLLDTDGDALREGIEAAPTAVSPNQHEAERLLNRALVTRNHFLDAVARIRAMGPETVVLSLGSRGAVGAIEGAIIEALPPRVEVLCPIGAGDALAAAFAWSMERTAILRMRCAGVWPPARPPPRCPACAWRRSTRPKRSTGRWKCAASNRNPVAYTSSRGASRTGDPSKSENVMRSAGVVSAAVFLSRISGLVREMIMARLFGAGEAYDAFLLGFRIPNLARDLFAEGALSSAFVPVFSQVPGHQGQARSRRAFEPGGHRAADGGGRHLRARHHLQPATGVAAGVRIRARARQSSSWPSR